LNGRSEIRNILGSSRSSFDMAQAVRDNKIILINLAGLGKKVRSLLGAIFIDALLGAIRGGAGDPRQPFNLILDELQNYPVLATDPDELLSEGLGFGLRLVLANQGLAQLPVKLANAVMVNCANKIVFQTDAGNASAFKREFGDD